MNNIDTLTINLHNWKSHVPRSEPHLSSADLYALSAPEALPLADPVQLQHLSLCPTCIEEWANWCKARSAVREIGEQTNNGISLSHGYLRAAASPEMTDSVSMQSQCGNYRLEILTGGGTPCHGLVTFEALVGGNQLENSLVSICDQDGKTLLKGRLSDGRLARAIENPNEFDLSTWTVSITKDKTDKS